MSLREVKLLALDHGREGTGICSAGLEPMSLSMSCAPAPCRALREGQ